MEALAERQLDILRNIRRDSMSLDPNTLNKLVHDYEELRTQMDGAWKQVRHKVEGPAHQMRNDSTIPVSQPKQSAAWRFPWR
ncbi:hypothetical protein ID866_6358 [Astraeus odoratus]|nr:hypothetical protein ID866_6358 [Astraeus odoratus]